MKEIKGLKALNKAGIGEIMDINILQEALGKVHKGVKENNVKNCTCMQKWHNEKTNVLPLNIKIGDSVLIRTHAKREHKLQSK